MTDTPEPAGGEGVDWGAMLDRLSDLLDPLEQEGVRKASADRDHPRHVRELHMHVAKLLLKYEVASWEQLRTDFPEYHNQKEKDKNPATTLEGDSAADSSCMQQASQATAAREPTTSGPLPDSSRAHSQLTSAGKPPVGLVPKRKPESAAVDGEEGGAAKRQNLEAKAPSPSAVSEATPQPTTPRAGASSHISHTCILCNGDSKPTLENYPRIVAWWHPLKNHDKRPADFDHSSPQRVWLQCPGCPSCEVQHEWDEQVKTLMHRGGDIACGMCTGTTSFCACRAVAADARLAAEWHEDNPSAASVSASSRRMQKWRCADQACGHVWEATPWQRTSRGTICPECLKQGKVARRRQPTLAVGRPDLLEEWDLARNGPANVTLGSNKEAWWVCKECGGTWQSKVIARALRNTSHCPHCQETARQEKAAAKEAES